MSNTIYDLVISGGTIVTADAKHRVIDDGVVAVAGDTIAVILTKEQAAQHNLTAREHINAANMIVMPALINSHCHLADSLFRGLVEGLSLEAWLQVVWKAEHAILNPETTHLGSLLGLAENLLGGVATVVDMFWYPQETARAARLMGMRLSTGGIFFDPPGVGGRSQQQYQDEARQFIKDHKNSDDIFPAVMPHGCYTVCPENLTIAKTMARDEGALFHIHAAETRAEQADITNRYGRSVIRHMEALDLLDDHTHLAHCVHLDDEEIDILARTHASVIHNPLSNLKLGSGIAPIDALRKAGVLVTLGTDGAISGNDLDMWLTMRLAATLPKGYHQQADMISPHDVLHMATLHGARALGLENRLGSLEEGKLADIILLNCDRPHSVPMFDPITHLVYSAAKSDVRHVFVGGTMLVRDGVILTLDINDVMARTRALVPKIKAAIAV